MRQFTATERMELEGVEDLHVEDDVALANSEDHLVALGDNCYGVYRNGKKKEYDSLAAAIAALTE